MPAKKTARKAKAAAVPKGNSPKAKLPKQDLTHLLLLEEMRAFTKCPRPDLVALAWLHDDDIEAVPSKELLTFIVAEMLYGPWRSVYFDAAASDGFEKTFLRFLHRVKNPSFNIERAVEDALLRLRINEAHGAKSSRTHWQLCILSRDLDHGHQVWNDGARVIAQRLLELMTLRAVRMRDASDIIAMAEVLGNGRGFENDGRQVHHKMALEIITWIGFLARELKGLPTKSEVQKFMENLIESKHLQGTSTDQASMCPVTWSKLWREFRIPTAPARSRKVDEHRMKRLAQKASKMLPPKARKAPEWERMIRGR